MRRDFAIVTDKDLKQTELGVSIKPLRLAAILKSAPLLPQSEALGFQMAVDETSSESSKGKSAAARDPYECKYICCCVILVLLGLLLSQVLAFLYHLFPFSFVRRSLSSSSVCLFVLVYFVVRAVTTPYVSCSGYGLVPVLSVSCSISFRACLIQISFFRFVVVHSSQVHLVWSPPPKACSRCFL